MTGITLDQANRIVAAGFEKGRELGLKPLSIAVLDPGGHLVAFARADGSSTLRPQIACAKAGGALGLGVSSRVIGRDGRGAACLCRLTRPGLAAWRDPGRRRRDRGGWSGRSARRGRRHR